MSEHTVGIIGAGTMGAGIAQVAAAAGWNVELLDVDRAVVERAVESIGSRFARLVEKGRMTLEEADTARFRVRVARGPASFEAAELVIEAVVEDLDVKAIVLGNVLPVVTPETIIATNTSSLPVSLLGARLQSAHRVVGMHFFNPAPVMRLVEIVAGRGTTDAVVDRAHAIAESWGKVVVRAADVPGFVVNHVARPYYLEAFRLVEEKIARPDDVDRVMREKAGFRMGPLELTDLIGQDVNAATTRSVWSRLGEPPLLRPSPVQEKLVADGDLGRKTGRGVYQYVDGKQVKPALRMSTRRPRLSRDERAAVQAFAEQAVDAPCDPDEAYVVGRILGGLIVQAGHAVERGVADRESVDTALVYGANYPMGPFAWLERAGLDACIALLQALNAHAEDGRFAAPAAITPAL